MPDSPKVLPALPTLTLTTLQFTSLHTIRPTCGDLSRWFLKFTIGQLCVIFILLKYSRRPLVSRPEGWKRLCLSSVMIWQKVIVFAGMQLRPSTELSQQHKVAAVTAFRVVSNSQVFLGGPVSSPGHSLFLLVFTLITST